MTKGQQSFDGEEQRLAALASYHVLDTLPEKQYDAITRLASYICQVPIALISLLDGERQWFKSKVGLGVDETPRADAFCHYTILSDEILEVDNVLNDDRFKDNRLVLDDPHIQFYAGAPLIDPEGHHLGSLCVIDRVPRKLSDEQKDALRTLADEVMSNLLLNRKKKELEAAVKAREDFYQLFNSSSEIHYILSTDGKIEVINDAVTNVLGYKPADVIGKLVWDFVGETGRDKFAASIEKAVATGEPFENETATKTITGDIKWIGWTSVYKNGKWYASGRDITYQKQLMANLKELSEVASSMTNGVVIRNARGEIIWVNEAFERVTGFVFTDVKGKQLAEVITGHDNESFTAAEYRSLISRERPYAFHVHTAHKDGELVWLSLTNTIIFDDHEQLEKQITIIADITSRKLAQRDMEILSLASRMSPSGLMIRDADGIVTWMNDAMEHMLGYTLSEMRGKTFGSMLFGEKTDKVVLQQALDAIKRKQAYEVELELYRKDGTPVWISVANTPLVNETGLVERQVASLLDITDRKNAEARMRMLSLVASNTNSGVVINNADGEVEWINEAFENITGYSIDDLYGKQLGDIIKGESTDESIIKKARELSRNKQSFEIDLLVYRKDGQPLWISVINSVILNDAGEVEKYIEVIIDITSKKKVEIELISAKEEAQQLSRAKDMFISVMSHEIRTPLNAVIGISRLLVEENPMDYQKENLDVLRFSAQNLMALINDVLDFTKIETGNVELEKTDVNLRDLVQGIISTLHYKTEEKAIYLKQQIDPAVPDLVIGDSTRLSQILLNLVGNAVKFTEEGGVTIGLTVIEQTEKKARIRFSVTDTGIGIADNKLNTIFESFKQADLDTTRKYGGTGLGLAISKRLIELHDSRINVESVLSKGSNFWFTISFNKKNTQANKYQIDVDSTLNISVLVVDDNQINRLLINKILTKWGAKADFAENGLQAVEKVENGKPYDVVLMDIHMPEMGGLEATQIIRSMPDAYFQQLPIIALTASMMSSEMNQIGNSGMNDYVLKPFEPKVLFEKLSRYQKQ